VGKIDSLMVGDTLLVKFTILFLYVGYNDLIFVVFVDNISLFVSITQ